MTFDAFAASLTGNTPPENLTPYLAAMWHDGVHNWRRAHEIVQDLDDATASWIHAYLHRKEGDASNAGYWYRRAKKPVPASSLEKEWEDIVRANLLSEP